MIEILCKDDVNKVSDPVLVAGLNKEFDRLPDDYLYPEYGYFVVIEELEELTNPIELIAIISQHTARSLQDCLEVIEEFEGYFQVVMILNIDYGISVFFNKKLMTFIQMKRCLSL